MLHLRDTCTLESPPERIWPRIFDPISLMGMIPGCEHIEEVAPGEYRGRMRVGIAAVAGVFDTLVRVLESDPPHTCRLHGEVSGPTGVIAGEAAFRLEAAGEQTVLAYEGSAMITGALGQMNPRFVEGVARTLIQHGLHKLNRELRGEEVLPE